jgi:hypothetical protein
LGRLKITFQHYVLCSQGTETIQHLLLAGIFSTEFWFLLLCQAGMQRFTPPPNELELADWWTRCWKQVQKDHHKGFDAMVVLGCWMLWLGRNAQVVNRTIATTSGGGFVHQGQRQGMGRDRLLSAPGRAAIASCF